MMKTPWKRYSAAMQAYKFNLHERCSLNVDLLVESGPLAFYNASDSQDMMACESNREIC